MRRIAPAALAGALLLLLFVPALAKSKADDEPDLAGTYTVTSGKLPDGSPYTGTLTLTPKTRMGGKHGMLLWSLVWKISSATEPVNGIGLFMSGVFVVAYGPGDDYGLSVYFPIARGGRREWMLADDTSWGTWCNATGGIGQEGLRGERDSWEGDYRLHGHTLAAGEPTHPYSGNLSMTKSGETVHLRWSGKYTKGRDKPFDYTGVGLDVPGLFAAQWSDSGKGGIGVYVFDGGAMNGLFTEGDGIGEEKLAIPPEVAARLAPFLSSN